MKTTKKMPVSISYGEFNTKKNEFLVPFGKKELKNGFMGIKSGEEFQYGAISYIGTEISQNDILNKIIKSGIAIKDKKTLIFIFEEFLKKLQPFKIGNIIKIEYLKDGNFNLVKVSEKPQRKKKSKIP